MIRTVELLAGMVESVDGPGRREWDEPERRDAIVRGHLLTLLAGAP